MDLKTLRALEASIDKWRNNSVVEEPEDYLIGVTDCPLCALFYGASRSERCKGCPISGHTGRITCQDTPYDEACRARATWSLIADDGDDDEVEKARNAAHAAALKEVEFLESLLPDYKTVEGAT